MGMNVAMKQNGCVQKVIEKSVAGVGRRSLLVGCFGFLLRSFNALD